VRRVAATIAGVLLAARAHGASGAGEDIGQTIRPVVTARQAATGGLDVEDRWVTEGLLEGGTILTPLGLRWYRAGGQVQILGGVRLGGEIFGFSSGDIVQTLDDEYGQYAGEGGTVSASENGGRLTTRFSLSDGAAWSVSADARVVGLVRRVPDRSETGLAGDVGATITSRGGGDGGTSFWVMVGPIGKAGESMFAGQVTGGVSMTQDLHGNRDGGFAGYAGGIEAEALGEGLFQAGVGAACWFKAPESPRWFFLRAGARYVQGGVATVEPRAGVGVLWRQWSGIGVEFDYAAVSAGAMGLFHYVTLTVRMPEARERIEQ